MSQPILLYDFRNCQETVISELDEEKGNFLCGPEWKVKITTKAGQDLDIKQVIIMSPSLISRNGSNFQLHFRLRMVMTLGF